ncbi:hypothetical protein ACIRP5_08300 [Streptomyces sp. NPDC101221]|uniref:hypothetical protein n=1 Tax=Streptomyces sp. NPDC101221 TaxID=3366132 RepID=UPI0038133E56
MGDLYIDFEMLEKAQKDIRDIHEVMATPCRDGCLQAREADGRRRREWSYGIKQMSKFSKSAAKALGQIKKIFQETDEQFARELEKAWSGKGGKR